MRLEYVIPIDTGAATIVIRKAAEADVTSVANIYKSIHALEQAGKVSIGWNPDVYPVRETAEKALLSGTLFVMTLRGEVIASAIINNQQPEAYFLIDWQYPAIGNKVGVLHTLVVSPRMGRHGYGKLFVKYFENYCKELGCEVVRLDIQVKNSRPFNMYPKLGYRLAGIRETSFQNLPQKIELAMFEKKL